MVPQWDYCSDCMYHCMLSREEERAKLGDKPIKYRGRWPFHRVFDIQEPVSMALSTLNLGLIFYGWVSFFILLYYKLPLQQNGKTYYEYTAFMLSYDLIHEFLVLECYFPYKVCGINRTCTTLQVW